MGLYASLIEMTHVDVNFGVHNEINEELIGSMNYCTLWAKCRVYIELKRSESKFILQIHAYVRIEQKFLKLYIC